MKTKNHPHANERNRKINKTWPNKLSHNDILDTNDRWLGLPC